MASWGEVQSFLEKTYSVQKKDGDLWTGTISYNDGRSQVVGFQKVATKDGKVWLTIDSPVGEIPSKDNLDKAMDFLFSGACGGLVKAGKVYFVRHGTPIDDISADEIVSPVSAVCAIADVLEEKLVGGDKW